MPALRYRSIVAPYTILLQYLYDHGVLAWEWFDSQGCLIAEAGNGKNAWCLSAHNIFILTLHTYTSIINHMVKYTTYSLNKVFAALSDPTRRAILERLAQGDASVSELAAPFAMSLPAISKHLRVLEQAGLIARTRDGRVHRLRLVTQPLHDAAAWIVQYQRFWEDQLDALADYLSNTDHTDDHKEPTP